MKKYNVNVNGTAYEVTVEEVVGGAAPAPVAAAPAAAPAPAPVAAPAGAGEQVKSPMPGNILPSTSMLAIPLLKARFS